MTKTPLYENCPSYLIPADEVELLKDLVGMRVDAVEYHGAGLSGTILTAEKAVGFGFEPSNCGASPALPDCEELIRLSFRATRYEDSYETISVDAVLSDVFILHAAVIFGIPQEVPAEKFAVGEGEIELPAGISYGSQVCRPVPEERYVPYYNAAIATGMINQVDLGIRLKFDDDTSLSFATDGCAIFFECYQGEEEEQFLQDVMQVPLSHRM